MSETNINEQDWKNLLSSIFKISKKGDNIIMPIIEDSTNIPNLLVFLNNKENNIADKEEIIYILFYLFKENNLLLPFFMKKNLSNNINLYEPLIDLYFSKDQSLNKYGEYFYEFIKMIRKNITLAKGPIEHIYQKLSLYFESNQADNIERLNESLLLKYLDILKLFYIGEKNENIFTDTENNQNIKEIKNYIYFNGIKSCLTLDLNKNSINPNTDFPTLKFGLSFVLWVYLDEKLINKYKEINNNTEIKLVVINISGQEIKLVLNDLNTLQVSLKDSKVQNIRMNTIKLNDWNNICFSFLEKNGSKLPLKLFINGLMHNSFLEIPNNFSPVNKIDTIKLFENFIGKVSSLMIITKVLDQKEVNYFCREKIYGFYKNKILFDFILSNEKKYFSNCINYKYYEKIKSNKSTSFYDFKLKKQNLKNMISIFCPFSYNKDKNQIDDIFGNFIGILGENDGVNYFINNSKTISQLGGINNLLPIIELMYSTISKSKKMKYNLVDKSILTQFTFYEFLNLIKSIIIGNNQNLADINNSKFFSSLSLFIEKFPSDLFTPKILEILLEIGKESFQNVDKVNSRTENYISLILLNEKIISKYNAENQIFFWKSINSFFTSDDTQIKDLFNIRKICLLLRLFDEKRYDLFCCKKHADVFKNEGGDTYDMKIMEPELDVRLNELFKIIQIFINKFCDNDETVNLFQLLSLDLSPCLQNKIIEIYLNYFENKKIELNAKIKSLEFLIKNNFIELIEYVFNISLFDVRIKILSLFKIILERKELKNKFQNYISIGNNGMNNFYLFISENLLPDQLYVEIEENKNNIIEQKNISLDNLLKNTMGNRKKKDLVPLTNYFNKKLYEKEANDIWGVLLCSSIYGW